VENNEAECFDVIITVYAIYITYNTFWLCCNIEIHILV